MFTRNAIETAEQTGAPWRATESYRAEARGHGLEVTRERDGATVILDRESERAWRRKIGRAGALAFDRACGRLFS